jgi:hypothetical protein
LIITETKAYLMNFFQHHPRLKSNLLSLTVLSALTACVGVESPSRHFEAREQALHSVRTDGDFSEINGEFDTLADLVGSYQDKAQDAGDLSSYIDYYLVRQAAIRVLEDNINTNVRSDAFDKNDPTFQGWLAELEDINPESQVLLSYLESQQPINARIATLLRLAPSSQVAALHNASFYEVLYDRPVLNFASASDVTGIASKRNRERLKRLLDRRVKSTESCKPTRPAVEVSDTDVPVVVLGKCLFDLGQDLNIAIQLHPSAIQKLSDPVLTAKLFDINPGKVGDLLGEMASIFGLNFVLGFDKITVFGGQNIPRDLDAQQNVYTVKPRHVKAMTVMNALASTGYTRMVTGIDVDSNVIWVSANLHDYLNAMQVYRAIDKPTSQLRVNMEIIEVEQSLLSEIGLRIPQSINFALSDPTFRYYNYGANVPLANNGLVTTSSATGSVSLANLKNQKFDNLVRAIVRDDGFRLAAKEQNYTIEINERPVLLMKSGDVSTLNIGSRLPVVTSGVAGNGVITESVTMLDLGLRINIGAQVLDENNVNFDVGLNVSHLLRETESARGTSQPHLTTRDIDTSLVVKDGETAMLGGITSLSNRRQLDGIPGLARNPLTVVAGGANENSEVKNDLLILITPEILLNSSGDIYAGGASVYGNEVNPGLNAAMSRALESYLNSSAQPRTPVTPTRGRPPVRR